MRASITHRDHALGITVWLVVLTQAFLFGLLAILHGLPTGPDASLGTFAIVAALISTCAALAVGHRPLALGLAVVALLFELINVPVDNKLAMLLAGLHAAHVAAGVVLIAWMIAIAPGMRNQHLPRLVGRYWQFITAVWLVVWPLIGG